MAGSIKFAEDYWDGKSSAAHYVMDFIADQLPPGAAKVRIRELADDNVLMLDLSDPQDAGVVDILVDELPKQVAAVDDENRRRNLNAMLTDLYKLAKQQQQFNARHASD